MNKTFIIVLILLAILGAVFVKTYTSSPGFVTQETAAEFEKTKPKCYGISILLNAEQMAADAPGKSLCVGFLKSGNKRQAELEANINVNL